MTLDEFDAYCAAMKGTTHVVQWGNASVWKIGGKVFAICPQDESDASFAPMSFKCSDLAFELLPEQDGIIPAPYLARAKWVKLTEPDAMSDEDIRLHLDAAYEIIARKLTKKTRAELGLDF